MLRLAMVGTNFISDNLLKAVSEVPQIIPTAIYSRKQETGEVFAHKHNIPNVYTDYEEMLNSNIDAVYIASPIYIHAQQAMQAMRHKKHVLCEKIMAVNERETREMIACAKENGVVLLEAMRPDFDPYVDMIKGLLSKIGPLRRASLEYCQYSSRYDAFKEGTVMNAFNPELANAAIMDIGVYSIHEAVYLFGEPKSVKAMSTFLENGFEADGIVLMQYDGFVVEAVYSKIASTEEDGRFVGEKGVMYVSPVSRPKRIWIRYKDGTTEDIEFTAPELNMIYEVKAFYDMVVNGREWQSYLEYTLKTVQIVDEARRQTGIIFHADEKDVL